MKIFTLFLAFVGFSCHVFSQDINKIINEAEVLRIEKVLADDNMQGRKPGTAGIKKAADFIAKEFENSGLEFLPGSSSYFQNFSMLKAKTISVKGSFDDIAIDSNKIIAVSPDRSISINQASDLEVVHIAAGKSIFQEVMALMETNENFLVVVDTSYRANFRRLNGFKREMFSHSKTVVFVLSPFKPTKFNIEIQQDISSIEMSNVVAYLPGKTKKDELVIFSGHYDHLGIGKPTVERDSIYNGANDDAAGTTGVVMLSKYFSEKKNNERSLVFVAFTAEESGGFGSSYFSKQIDPAKAIAMFNIEMIGTESKWGTNSAYITGFEKSGLAAILQKNLEGSKFTFYPDPYPDQKLFYRSDNAKLAELGVPAHTISTSKMDAEPFYHSADDEIETLDLQNMTEIIKSIAISAKTIISGVDTPSRVEPLKK